MTVNKRNEVNLENQSWSLYRQCNLITLLINRVKNQYIHELYAKHLAMVDSIGYVMDSFWGHSAQSKMELSLDSPCTGGQATI